MMMILIDNLSQVDKEKSEVLSSPKASYYPTYIRQNMGENGKILGRTHKTFMDDQPEIAGWKRYPVHANGVKSNPKPAKTSDKVLTKFIPLKEGVIFEGTIRYHNLRKEELGALLSALTFHNTENTFHSIGMAKPLGYGTEWHVSEQITELMTMVSEQNNQGNSELKYMKLGVQQKENHFVNAKKAAEALDVYSKLNGIQRKQGATYTSPAAIATAKAKMAHERTFFDQNNSRKADLTQLKAEKKDVIRQVFDRKRNALITQLQEQQLKKAAAARIKQEAVATAARKAERMEAAQSSRPDFASINPSSKKAFEELKKNVRRYVEDYHGKKYDQLKAEISTGVLPANFHAELIEFVKAIYQSANKKVQKKWELPIDKNANMKCKYEEG